MLTVQEIYDKLVLTYGKPQWWSDNPYQVMVEAVLVQHTTWNSVKKLRPVMGEKLLPLYIQKLLPEELEDLIRPCGFQKAKAQTIQAITGWFMKYDCSVMAACAQPLSQLRKELLALRGVGGETADVILVYAFHQPTFIVDAYTRAFLKRLGYSFVNDIEIKGFFEQYLGKDPILYGYLHWLILDHCIARCKKKPSCDNCIFQDRCHGISQKV